jgi:peptide/nickel transport system permease protein
MNLVDRFAPPSATYWMGTDNLGRDTFSRLLQGGRIALYVALTAVSISGLIGLVLGMLAGFGPRWLDNALLFFFDTLRAYPTIILALALAALMPRGLGTVIIVVVITSFAEYGRVVRTQTLSLKNSEFILAERAMGASFGAHRLSPHPAQRARPLLHPRRDEPARRHHHRGGDELSGHRRAARHASWGATLKDGFDYIRTTPWILLSGGLPLILATLGFTFLGEALRDQLDPRLRKSR